MTATLDEKFVELLATTTDRSVPAGDGSDVLWCPQTTGQDLLFRLGSRDVLGLCVQAVRLVRAMHLADARGFIGFLYMNRRLPALRARLFRNSFAHALSSGQLRGIVELDDALGLLRFLEPEMELDGEGFDLTFGQMPLVAAFVDAAYLGVTPERFEAILGPVLSPGMEDDARTVADSLRNAVLEWLRSHLDSDHFTRQTAVLRTFCMALDPARPETIDDRAVFDFWRDQLEEGRVDGFRKFRNAAHRILAYRRAWIEARIQHNVASAASFDRIVQDNGAVVVDLERTQLSPLEFSEWLSPLTVLSAPPCDCASWLSARDRSLLAHQIADPRLVDGQEVETKDAASLFANEPPLERFYRTLLRFTFFGALQAVMMKGRSRSAFADYEAIVRRLGEIEDNMITTIGHAAKLLARYDNPTGQRSIVHLFPEIRQGLRHLADGDTFAAKGLPDLRQWVLEDGETIARKLDRYAINRAGLRQADLDLPGGEDAFSAGLDAMMSIHKYLRHYLDWLEKQDLATCFAQDLSLFMPSLEKLYGASGKPAKRRRKA